MKMSLQEQLRQLEMDGLCVIEEIVPSEKVDAIRAQLAKTRALGHCIGVQGVSNLKQVLNATQSFAPYLAAPYFRHRRSVLWPLCSHFMHGLRH